MGGKTERADAPWAQEKTTCKKNSSKKNKKVFWVAVAAEPVQGELAHGEN